jgi:hypothetical protein
MEQWMFLKWVEESQIKSQLMNLSWTNSVGALETLLVMQSNGAVSNYLYAVATAV